MPVCGCVVAEGGCVVAVCVWMCVLAVWLSVVDVCVGCVWLRGVLLTHVSNLPFSSAGGGEEGRRVKNRGAVFKHRSAVQPRARARGGWKTNGRIMCFLVCIHLPLYVERECPAPW